MDPLGRIKILMITGPKFQHGFKYSGWRFAVLFPKSLLGWRLSGSLPAPHSQDREARTQKQQSWRSPNDRAFEWAGFSQSFFIGLTSVPRMTRSSLPQSVSHCCQTLVLRLRLNTRVVVPLDASDLYSFIILRRRPSRSRASRQRCGAKLQFVPC